MTIAEIYSNNQTAWDKALQEVALPCEQFIKKAMIAAGRSEADYKKDYGGDRGAKIWDRLGKVSIESDTESGMIQVVIRQVGNFRVRRYPSCCGLYMFHDFHDNLYEFKPPDELIFPIIDYILVNMVGQDVFGKNYRFQVMMVENSTPDTEKRVINAASAQNTEDFRTVEIPNIGNPQINHSLFYRYFTKHCKWHRDRIFYNTNSNNLIHELEVLIK